MLNMIHASTEKQTYLSENALTDLNMSFFADAEFSKKYRQIYRKRQRRDNYASERIFRYNEQSGAEHFS